MTVYSKHLDITCNQVFDPMMLFRMTNFFLEQRTEISFEITSSKDRASLFDKLFSGVRQSTNMYFHLNENPRVP